MSWSFRPTEKLENTFRLLTTKVSLITDMYRADLEIYICPSPFPPADFSQYFLVVSDRPAFDAFPGRRPAASGYWRQAMPIQPGGAVFESANILSLAPPRLSVPRQAAIAPSIKLICPLSILNYFTRVAYARSENASFRGTSRIPKETKSSAKQ
jgi:hypothetical protein